MPFSNLVCDLDGTLVDSYPGIEASARYACELCLANRIHPPIREYIGPPILEMFDRMYPDLKAEQLTALVAAFRSDYDSRGWRRCLPFSDVPSTVKMLAQRGVRLFVLTNKPAQATSAILEKAGIARFFTAVVSPDSCAPSYSNKVAAALALQNRHELVAGETVLVGDGLDDARAAAACGFAFLFANYGYGARSHSAGVIEKFSDLLTV